MQTELLIDDDTDTQTALTSYTISSTRTELKQTVHGLWCSVDANREMSAGFRRDVWHGGRACGM